MGTEQEAMPIYKALCDTPYMRKVKAAIGEIAHLPLVERLTHHNARRPLAASMLGVGVMLTGCVIASSKEELHHTCGGHHILWDAVGYFLHGAGAIPLLRYIEPLWALLLGSSEVVGEAAVVAGAALVTGGVVAAMDATHDTNTGTPARAGDRKGQPSPPFRQSKRRKNGRRK